jgi:GTP-binding protein
VRLLRKSNKPVIYVANKVDRPGRADIAGDLFRLGLPELVPVSAVHGLGTAELAQAIARTLPAQEDAPDQADDQEPRVALLGRPNAGISSLVNRLSGTERSLVDDRPGTTRDPVDSRIVYGKEELVIVDTAGIRRRARVERGLELVSVLRAIRAVERANVAVLLCDASEGVAEQDARLLGLCMERRRAIVVGLNKMDLVPKDQRKGAIERARDTLSFARWAPVVPLSAKTGSGVSELVQAVSVAATEVRRRVPTAELNRFFRAVLDRQPPPTYRGKAPRIYFLTQAESAPPRFVAWASAPESIRPSYQRFVENQIRKAFGFTSVPVEVTYRQRERKPRRGRAG